MRRGRRTIATKLSRLVARIFPDRQLILRADGKVQYLTVPRAVQMAATVAAVVVIGWVAFTSIGYFLYEDILERRGRELAETRGAHDALATALGQARQSHAAVTRSLEDSHSQILNLVEQNRDLQHSLSAVRTDLRETDAAWHRALAQRDARAREATRLAAELRGARVRTEVLRAEVAGLESALARITDQREQAIGQREKLAARVGELETELVNLEAQQRDVVFRLSENTAETIEAFERTLRMTGVEIDPLLARLPGEGGQGGPFIPFDPAAVRAAALGENLDRLDQQIGRWERIQAVLQILPLVAPMEDYRVSSGFGRRHDPINGRMAFHAGVDLTGRARAGVYTPAPGRVTFVGWKGRYGKMIEIDHGAGVRTRYGHLRKIYVKLGQEVGYRDKIGQVGTTGRSTGPHLHYEIKVGDKQRDPMKFFRAGMYVFKE